MLLIHREWELTSPHPPILPSPSSYIWNHFFLAIHLTAPFIHVHEYMKNDYDDKYGRGKKASRMLELLLGRSIVNALQTRRSGTTWIDGERLLLFIKGH